MGVKRGLHHCNANLLWSRGSLLYSVSGSNVLEYGELSTIRGRTQARNEPYSVGQAQGNADRGPDIQT